MRNPFKNKKQTQTPVEFLWEYMKHFNCFEETLATRKAYEKALKMEAKKNNLYDWGGYCSKETLKGTRCTDICSKESCGN